VKFCAAEVILEVFHLPERELYSQSDLAKSFIPMIITLAA
jgi:hypothetical protein